MRLRDIAEKYQGIPENSKVVVPGTTTQHNVFLCRHSTEEYNDKYYQSVELSLAEVKDGDTLYFPEGYQIPAPNPDRTYKYIWEIYTVKCLLPDGTPVPVKTLEKIEEKYMY
jgi:hypothetical protein